MKDHALRCALKDYLSTRRALGFKLERDHKLLPGFIDHLTETGNSFITTKAAVAWATLPQGVEPNWWALRLVMVRGFAKYMQTIDPRTEVPPLELLPHQRFRSPPYVYNATDIYALLRAAEALRMPLMAATYSTLLGAAGPSVGYRDSRRRGHLARRQRRRSASRSDRG